MAGHSFLHGNAQTHDYWLAWIDGHIIHSTILLNLTAKGNAGEEFDPFFNRLLKFRGERDSKAIAGER